MKILSIAASTLAISASKNPVHGLRESFGPKIEAPKHLRRLDAPWDQNNTCAAPDTSSTAIAWPNDKRQKQLQKRMPWHVKFISEDEYVDMFDDEMYANTYLHTRGLVVPKNTGGCSDGFIIIDGTDLENLYEAKAIAASKCVELDCDYYHIVTRSSLSTQYTVCFFTKEAVHSVSPFPPVTYPESFGVGLEQRNTVAVVR